MLKIKDKKDIEEAVIAHKILASETRFKILSLLTERGGDLCVNEIAYEIGMSQSATSHQLLKLEDRGVVSPVRDGQNICYHLTDSPLSERIRSCIYL